MAFFDRINDEQQAFIAEQKIFFTATAPGEGRINLSPKGMDSFRCLDERTVAYLDLTGSGNETAAHVRENSRITLMFCSFSEKPLILRLYGHARVVGRGDGEWGELSGLFPTLPATRQIFVVEVGSVQTSCGFGVPVYDLVEERKTLAMWGEKKRPEELEAYWRKKNLKSIDGLDTGLLDKA